MQGGAFHATANALSVIAGRLSFVFNLAGELNSEVSSRYFLQKEKLT
jgi:hypothetical protein